jgi:hypothetical protein
MPKPIELDTQGVNNVIRADRSVARIESSLWNALQA